MDGKEIVGDHHRCVGSGTLDPSRVWFTPWFLSVCYVDTNAVIWQRDGRKITKTYKPEYVRPSGKPNAPQRIWFLTDIYDSRGYRLGVWPD